MSSASRLWDGFALRTHLVGLLALFLPRAATLVLLLLLTGADIICGACMTYYVPVRECLQNMRVAIESSAAHPLRSLLVLSSFLLIAATAFLMPNKELPKKQRRLAAACLVAFGLVTLCGDVVSTHQASGYPRSLFEEAPHSDGLSFSSKIPAPRLARLPVVRLTRLWSWNASLSAYRRERPDGAIPRAERNSRCHESIRDFLR